MAIYSCSHRTIGRSTHVAGTAGAHVGYITRASACRAVIAEHIPEAAPGSKGGAARAWLDAQELADRKNARVVDKLMLALPLELDEAQRVATVRSFVMELAGGRSVPFFAAFHDRPGTKDASNPHAHLVIRDRDPVTGKGRVIGMSEKGSTERAREVWERVCNEALAQAGSSARIDRRSLKAQGIDRAPQGHHGPQARQIAARGKPCDKLRRIRSAPGHDPALCAPERRQRAWEAVRQERDHQDALRASERAQEARRRQEASDAAGKAGEALQRAAVVRAEAQARERTRLASLGRALIEQDRARVMLVTQHHLDRIGAEWAAIETPPRSSDLDAAAQWLNHGHGKRLEDSLLLPPKPLWVLDFKETLLRAWHWIAGLIDGNDPAADQAAARWAGFHEQEPAAMGEWSGLVEQDAQAALRAGYRCSKPDRPQEGPAQTSADVPKPYRRGGGFSP